VLRDLAQPGLLGERRPASLPKGALAPALLNEGPSASALEGGDMETTATLEKKERKPALAPRDWFEELGAEMARVWHDRPLVQWPSILDATRRPSIDVFRRGDRWIVQADLPGVKRDEIDLRLEDGDLILSGERKAREEVREQDCYRMERTFGSFSRRVRMPFDIELADIQAKLEDSVLTVEIRRPPGSKPASHTIKIH
jgi:HSP20 family protein